MYLTKTRPPSDPQDGCSLGTHYRFLQKPRYWISSLSQWKGDYEAIKEQRSYLWIFPFFSTLLLTSFSSEDWLLAARGLNTNCHGHSISHAFVTILAHSAEILFRVMWEHFWGGTNQQGQILTKKVTPFERAQRLTTLTHLISFLSYLTQSTDSKANSSPCQSNAAAMPDCRSESVS